MSCPGRTSATTHPAPVRLRSQNPSPEPKIRCLSPRLVDEDVVMYECEKEDPASVRLVGLPHPIILESASCLAQSVVAEPNAPVCSTATAPAEVDIHDDETEGEEWEEWEEEEDGAGEIDVPSSAGATTGSLLNNRAKPPSPPPRASSAPTLRFERPIEVQVPPPALASSGPTGVKIEDESEDHDDGLWREPTRTPGSFLQYPYRPRSGAATSGGHPQSTSERIATSKESLGSRGTEPARAQPAESEGEHEISMNLTTGTETASLELHLTSGSVDASREHSAAPSSKPTFDLKVTVKGPGRVSISAAWERAGSR